MNYLILWREEIDGGNNFYKADTLTEVIITLNELRKRNATLVSVTPQPIQKKP